MSEEAENKGSTAGSVIRVAVVEDHRVYRDYLVALLNGTPGLQCTESYRSMEEALERIGTDQARDALAAGARLWRPPVRMVCAEIIGQGGSRGGHGLEETR